MTQVASALAEAHAAGILHRDIRPANILLDAKGRAKVADFGLAKQSGVDVSVTATGAALGTPAYMAPEVAEGRAADALSDLYSLGATFYHVLAGRPPFEAPTPLATMRMHVEAEVPALALAVPDAPAALCDIIHTLLAKEPADRHQSAEGVTEAVAAMGDNPSHFARRPRNPVERVSWERCQELVQRLTETLKGTLRLPTEAEWEYACRSGTATGLSFGNGVADVGTRGWYAGNSHGSTRPVGKTEPNAWGLYDMHGNVWEWCEDRYAPCGRGPEKDPTGPGSGEVRVLRGGSWDARSGACRSAARGESNSWNEWADYGCRVCLRGV